MTESTLSPDTVGPTVRVNPDGSSIGTDTSYYPAALTLFYANVYCFGGSAFAAGFAVS